MEIYDGKAVFSDGSVVEASGTIQQMANWADNLIRMKEQDSNIQITRRQGGSPERRTHD